MTSPLDLSAFLDSKRSQINESTSIRVENWATLLSATFMSVLINCTNQQTWWKLEATNGNKNRSFTRIFTIIAMANFSRVGCFHTLMGLVLAIKKTADRFVVDPFSRLLRLNFAAIINKPSWNSNQNKAAKKCSKCRRVFEKNKKPRSHVFMDSVRYFKT